MYTSFSSASLHIGNRWERQNALLQVAHVVAVDRGVVDWSKPPEECDDSGMIVLLVKHVHLQKEGGAACDQQCGLQNVGFREDTYKLLK